MKPTGWTSLFIATVIALGVTSLATAQIGSAPTTAQVIAQDALPRDVAREAPRPAAIDANSLIGQWRGDLINQFGARQTAYFTFKRVEGERVVGVFHLQVLAFEYLYPYYNHDVDFVGTLQGNRIAISGVPTFVLDVAGDRIDGEWRGHSRTGRIRELRKQR